MAWSATAHAWFSTFFENAFVSQVNRGEEIGKLVAKAVQNGVVEKQPWYPPSEMFLRKPSLPFSIFRTSGPPAEPPCTLICKFCGQVSDTSLLMAGQYIGLDLPDYGMVWFVITGVFKGLGYVTTTQIGDGISVKVNPGDRYAVYKGIGIVQEPYSFTSVTLQ